jgi:hypothetical protein
MMASRLKFELRGSRRPVDSNTCGHDFQGGRHKLSVKLPEGKSGSVARLPVAQGLATDL